MNRSRTAPSAVVGGLASHGGDIAFTRAPFRSTDHQINTHTGALWKRDGWFHRLLL